MAVSFGQFYAACPGVVLTREVEAALAGLSEASSAAAIQAAVTPIAPLPAYPAGLKRFADSNPASDGWSIDRPWDRRHG